MFVCYVNQTDNWFDILACVRGWGGGGGYTRTTL